MPPALPWHSVPHCSVAHRRSAWPQDRTAFVAPRTCRAHHRPSGTFLSSLSQQQSISSHARAAGLCARCLTLCCSTRDDSRPPVTPKCPHILLGTPRHGHRDALHTPSTASHGCSKAIGLLGGAKAVAGQPAQASGCPWARAPPAITRPRCQATAD